MSSNSWRSGVGANNRHSTFQSRGHKISPKPYLSLLTQTVLNIATDISIAGFVRNIKLIPLYLLANYMTVIVSRHTRCDWMIVRITLRIGRHDIERKCVYFIVVESCNM